MNPPLTFWQKIPAFVYVGMTVGLVVGGTIGSIACFGYDLVNGPFLPQAGVDPQPAGWEGWWIGGGALIGMVLGLVVSLIMLTLWRLLGGSQPRTDE